MVTSSQDSSFNTAEKAGMEESAIGEGRHENGTKPRESRADDVGEQLIARHGTTFGGEIEVAQAGSEGTRPRLSGQRSSRNAEFIGNAADAIGPTVRHDRKPDAIGDRTMRPRHELGGRPIGRRREQRFIQIEQQTVDAEAAKAPAGQLLDPVDTKIGSKLHVHTVPTGFTRRRLDAHVWGGSRSSAVSAAFGSASKRRGRNASGASSHG